MTGVTQQEVAAAQIESLKAAAASLLTSGAGGSSTVGPTVASGGDSTLAESAAAAVGVSDSSALAQALASMLPAGALTGDGVALSSDLPGDGRGYSWAATIAQIVLTIVCMLGPVIWLAFKRRTQFASKPRIRTHVPRGDAENAIFLDRLVQSLFTMSLKHSKKEMLAKFATATNKLNAILEDSGHATDVNCQITNLGKQAPRLVAISKLKIVAPAGGSSSTSPKSNGGADTELSPARGTSGGDHHSPTGAAAGSTNTTPALGPSTPPAGLVPPLSGGGPSVVAASQQQQQASGEGRISPSALLAGSSSSSVEFECEIDWESEGFELGIKANVPIFRGRSLPLAVSLKDIEFAAHARVIATISEGAKELSLNVKLVSEPCFQAQLSTNIGSWISLKNSFGICYGLKYALVIFLRRKLVKGDGINIPLKLSQSLDPLLGNWWNSAGGAGTGGTLTHPTALTSNNSETASNNQLNLHEDPSDGVISSRGVVLPTTKSNRSEAGSRRGGSLNRINL